ncbi:MAG TPA: hypothetical protein HA356_04670 [Candidatus Poseidoniaceae archaeon]|nr:MAG TPA: hypothetical protein D7H95_04645 [Candidatus Poseidoniales archaeon]HII11350.1 hypothetical protein [Candidatus Poseidoniaceae archaeon]
MSEEQVDTTAAEPTEDVDRDEEVQAMTLEQRQEALKQSRWNVFLWLGIAVLMFGFALWPMSFDESYDGFTNSAEKDIGWVWGPSLPGEDFMDVPLTIDATVQNPPAALDVHLAAYALQEKDCGQNLGAQTELAREGTDHHYQYILLEDSPVAGGEYTFEFQLDSGHYCVIVQFVNSDGANIGTSATSMTIDGAVYPNQVIAGIFGIVCLSLSAFAFIGAQRHGESVRSLLEGDLETTETKVLASISSERISAGPAGPPGAPGADGPAGPPDASGPSGPPQEAEPATPESPTADAPVAEQAAEQSETYEPAENGYFFRKMPDGSYDQTVYVQHEDGTYSPHEA